MTRIVVWMICCLLAVSNVSAVERQDPAKSERPPSYILIQSEDGKESFTASCKTKATAVVTCDFIGMRINTPKMGQREMEIALADFEKQMSESGYKDEEVVPRLLSNQDKAKFQEQINDHATGPKAKQWLRELLAASSAHDFRKTFKLMLDRERRTCGIFIQDFSLDFQKIGKRKWLSNPGPSGFCNIMKVYELVGEPEHDLWTLTETRVTAGRTEGLFCEGIEEELNKPTVWSWRYPSQFELPCDFMSLRPR